MENVVIGPDGNVWFTAPAANVIGRLDALGNRTLFPLPEAASAPIGLTNGPDGALWFTEFSGNRIGRITTAGTITEYPIPTASSEPVGHRDGPGRGAVVHRERLQHDRRLDGGRNVHRDAGAHGHERTHEHHRRPRWRAVVHRIPRQPDRPRSRPRAHHRVPDPPAASEPVGITAGPDGRLWFTEFAANKIGALTTAGTFTEYPVPTADSRPFWITSGPGGLWFTELIGSKVGLITTAGAFQEFPIEPTHVLQGLTITADGTVWISQNEPVLIRLRFNQDRFVAFEVPPGYGEFIVTGPDGALWFTAQAQNLIGRITTAGEVTTTPVPTPNAGVLGITNGPDGALWFVERLGDKIGRITTDGRVQEFTIPTPGAQPADIATGPDGALWFTESGNNLLAKIGRLDTSGNFEEFPLPDPTSLPLGITAGPDGAMWFAENSGNKIGRIDVTTRVITEYPLPRAGMGPEYIVTGPDQNLWFTTFNGTAIGRITPSGVMTTRNAIGLTLDIAVGSDGNLWYSGFTEGTIGQASLSTFELTTQFFGLGTIHGITGGPDGNVWFTNLNGGRIGYYRLLTALALASQAVTPTAPPGGDITMSVVATNSGPDDAGAPTIAVQLDPQVGLVGFIPPPGWTCTFTEQALGNRGSCTGPQLRAGESVTLTITARLSAAATTGVVNSSFALASTTPHGTDPTVVLSTTIISGTPPPPPPTAVVWVPVGGPYVGDPAVVSTDGPSFHRQPTQVVFAVGPSGEPFFHERAGGGWSAAPPVGRVARLGRGPGADAGWTGVLQLRGVRDRRGRGDVVPHPLQRVAIVGWRLPQRADGGPLRRSQLRVRRRRRRRPVVSHPHHRLGQPGRHHRLRPRGDHRRRQPLRGRGRRRPGAVDAPPDRVDVDRLGRAAAAS